MSACDVVMETCIAHLKACGAMMETGDTVRGTGFIKLFARSLTIVHAVDKFARNPASPGHGRPITFAGLMDIAPYLVGTEEIAMFTMTILSDQLISANKLNLIALILAQCAPLEDGLTAVADEIECRCCEFRDKRYLFQALHVTQKSAAFRSKMSHENIRATYSSVAEESYMGRPILVHDEGASTVRLNKSYVEHYFEAPSGAYDQTFTPRNKFMPYEHILEAYTASYAHRHSCDNKKFILGCIPDLDFPFALNTFTAKRNADRIMTMHNKGADMEDGDAYSTVHASFEHTALAARGVEVNGDEILYGYPGYRESLTPVYPDTLIDQFAAVHRMSREEENRRPSKQPRY